MFDDGSCFEEIIEAMNNDVRILGPLKISSAGECIGDEDIELLLSSSSSQYLLELEITCSRMTWRRFEPAARF